MADWLRPGFLRSRTPVSLVPSDRASSFSHEESTCSEDGGPRLRPVSRVSSYIGFRPVTPPVVPNSQTIDNHLAFAIVRNPESVYYRPSCDQMAETLKVVMMNQSSITPIPIEYNSCVLHVLEAYQDLRMELNRKHVLFEQMESSHADDINRFENLASQWDLKESAYKADLKQVEVLLSQTEGGMEKVSMARSKSAVHGTREIGESNSRELGTMSKRGAQSSGGNLDTAGERTRYLLEQDNIQVKSRSTTAKTYQNSITDTRGRVPYRLVPPQLSGAVLHGSTYKDSVIGQRRSLSPPEQPSGFTRAQLEALDRQVEQELIPAFKPTSTKASVKSSLTTDSAAGQLSYFGSSLKGDPSISVLERLEAVVPPSSESSQLTHNESGSDDSLHNETPAGQMSFSFYPGDDSNHLAEYSTPYQALRTRPPEHFFEKSAAAPEQRSEASFATNDGTDSIQPKAKRNLKSEAMVMTEVLVKCRDKQRSDPLSREDSSSSIITAIRDSSGRSSNNSSTQAFRNLDRNKGSAEAVTAAVKAFGARKRADLEANMKNERENGSGSL